MPIADITDKILADAAKKGVDITNTAKDEAGKIKEGLEKSKKEMRENSEKILKKTLSENERRVTSAAEQEVKLLIAAKKRNVIDEVFNLALQKLLSLSGAEYKGLLKKTLKQTTGIDDGEILAPEERVGVIKEVIKELGLKNTVIPTDKFKGGVLIIGKDYEYNLTFENILANKKSSFEAEVAKLLFL